MDCGKHTNRIICTLSDKPRFYKMPLKDDPYTSLYSTEPIFSLSIFLSFFIINLLPSLPQCAPYFDSQCLLNGSDRILLIKKKNEGKKIEAYKITYFQGGRNYL